MKRIKNLEKYNSTEAPKYNVEELKKMRLDIFITVSTGDPYCLAMDYEQIFHYTSSARVFKKHVDAYNHFIDAIRYYVQSIIKPNTRKGQRAL